MPILLYGLWLVSLITIIITFALTQQRYVKAYMRQHRLDPDKADPQKTLNPLEGQRRAWAVVGWLGERQDDPALERLRGRTLLWLGVMICWGLSGLIAQGL